MKLQISLAVAIGWVMSYLFHVSILSYSNEKYILSSSTTNDISLPRILEDEREFMANNISLPPTLEDEREFMEMMEQRMKERINTINSACNSKRKEICKIPQTTFPGSLYNKNFKYTICRIQKVASSNWIRAILVMDNIYSNKDLPEHLEGADEQRGRAVRLRALNTISDKKERNRTSSEYLNIVMVRHPFLRVASAFHNKMSPDHKSWYFRPLSRKIEAAYRPMRSDPAQRKLPLTGAATFEDFVNFLVGDPQFDAYYDGHWKSFDSHCQPCLFNYDVIVKMESIEEDMQFLRKKLKVPEMYNEVFLWTRNRKVQHNETALFRQIPHHLVEKLYRKYATDFQLFGYSWPDWLPCKK